jgi:hypothetical protein
MKNLPPEPKTKPASDHDLNLLHCEEGDPCERIIEIGADGHVWVNALCGEILPVMKVLSLEVQQPDSL